MSEEFGLLLNSKEQMHFWRELERVEQWLSTGAGAAAGRVYDSMGRPGEQAFANYGNQLVAGVARVDRVRDALDQSAPIAKRLVMQQLSGIGLSAVWDILIAACKEIALYYGGSVVAGAVVGGAIGSLAFGVGAVPGAVIGTAAGAQVGMWVLAFLGLKELAEGLGKMFPAALEHYERGFREAWGAVAENRRDMWNSATLPSGNSHAGAWHMAQGHVILVTAILTALVAYLTRGRGNKALLMQEIRESRKLGPKFADWLAENEDRLIAQPQLQTRPNNSVAMVMEESSSNRGHGTPVGWNSAAVDADGANPAGPVSFANRIPDEKFSIEPVPILSAEQALRTAGKILYVVKADGSLVIARTNSDNLFGHFDLARGANILAGGEGRIYSGQVKTLDNASGHYLPVGQSARDAAINAFRNAGFKVPETAYVEKVYDFKLGKWVPK
ncbi:DUF6861 domain-containing protein [Pseudoduganella umbonata]|uniref:NAD(+)--protein-arginine ADP-ribosyltransferase Tre1-like N-terminal domain-containing protein n=1 Tax=Pseudoduganella umbonata TaxID=864828 RepID=A0A4P8HRS8_9BURK|nr:hypothetical protein [Pseudoduganella umbonata]MBB3224428.1 hypothetical protein [Pseudoduganella umbonata]QCP11214.1 hypothetical protein FCL38_12900 [Pseudoduganella umbonata]